MVKLEKMRKKIIYRVSLPDQNSKHVSLNKMFMYTVLTAHLSLF